MTLPASHLLSLPPGAVYHQHEGRAGLTLEQWGDSVRITADCDSLQRVVEWYEARERRILTALEQQQSSVKMPRANRWLVVALIVETLLLVLLVRLLLRKK